MAQKAIWLERGLRNVFSLQKQSHNALRPWENMFKKVHLMCFSGQKRNWIFVNSASYLSQTSISVNYLPFTGLKDFYRFYAKVFKLGIHFCFNRKVYLQSCRQAYCSVKDEINIQLAYFKSFTSTCISLFKPLPEFFVLYMPQLMSPSRITPLISPWLLLPFEIQGQFFGKYGKKSKWDTWCNFHWSYVTDSAT